jgi:hypothetical protein
MAQFGGVNYEGLYFIINVPAGWTPFLPLPDPGPQDVWFDDLDRFKAALEGPRCYRPLRRPSPSTLSGARSIGADGRVRLAGGVTLEGRFFVTPLPDCWRETDPLPPAGPDDVWFDRQDAFEAMLNGRWNRLRVRREPFPCARSSARPAG